MNLKEVRGIYAASTLALSNAFEEQATSDLSKSKRHKFRVLVHGPNACAIK